MPAPAPASGWLARRSRAGGLGLAGGLGALAALGQAPLGLWPATVLGLAGLFALFRRTGGWRRAAALGWAGGTGHFLLALSWIIEPFLVDVARHGWMAPFALALMAGGLALFWAAGFALARAAGRGAAAWIGGLLLAEAARGVLFTGFPWAQPGHAWIDTPLLHWAGCAGALGLLAAMLVAAAGLWHLLAGRRWAGAAGLAAVAVLYGAGAALTPPPADTREAPVVRLVQPNAPQHEKWDPEKIPVFFQRQIDYTRAGPRPDLVVWPETAIPVLLNDAQPTLDAIARAARGVPVVLGVQRMAQGRFYNSLVVLDADGGVTALYDKHHLVPFGEYIPFGDWLARYGIQGLAAQNGAGYAAGPGAQVIGLGDLGRALPLICYEGVFPRNVAAAPGRADFMLLVTNDAWFGRVSGPYQHLAQARLRSAEQGLAMVRVANTGVSAMIDPWGRVTARLPLGQAGWTDAPLPAPRPPTLYARTGDLPMLGLALLALLAAALLPGRRPPPNGD